MASYPSRGSNPAYGVPRPTAPYAMRQQGPVGVPNQGPHPYSGAWTTGLYSCSDDMPNFCVAMCCPCVLMGQIAEIVDEGKTSCVTAGCIFFWLLALAGSCMIYSFGYRARLRHKYGLPPEPCNDCCVDYWCVCCSLAQENRELKARGVDTALGWEANRMTYLIPPQAPKMQY